MKPSWRSRKTIFFFISLFSLQAFAENHRTPKLNFKQRDSLRYHLENLYNEVNLLIRNQKANEKDLARQEMDLEMWQLYDRIPFERDLPGLKKSLEESFKSAPLELLQFKFNKLSKPGKSIPKFARTSQAQYQLEPDQIAEKIYFTMKVTAPDEERLKKWIRDWPKNQFRMIELDTPKDFSKSAKHLTKNQWLINAHAFRFYTIQYPELLPENPINMLPNWAQQNPKSFAQVEPLLWSFVTRTEQLIPKTPALYKNRRQFLLNDARMNFFLSKSLAS